VDERIPFLLPWLPRSRLSLLHGVSLLYSISLYGTSLLYGVTLISEVQSMVEQATEPVNDSDRWAALLMIISNLFYAHSFMKLWKTFGPTTLAGCVKLTSGMAPAQLLGRHLPISRFFTCSLSHQWPRPLSAPMSSGSS
jgi:hypothetical protein